MVHQTAASTPRVDARERWAVGVFLLVGVLSSAWYLVIGRRLWFFNDEWDFLASRTIGDVHGLLTSHNGHWVTLPIVVYRFMWWVFGLRSYVPYQVLIVALHLLAAWLVRAIMRRAGVDPWIATVTAIVLVLFGTGHQDIIWPFQITYVGSVVFGLTHLLLADHDGGLDRRDWLGLAAGAAGLLCSGVAVTMVIVVGLATLLRRGLRVAAFHTVPLGSVYLLWYATEARDAEASSRAGLSERLRFIVTTPLNTLRAMSAYRGGQIVLLLVLVVGLVLAARGCSREQWSARYSAPVALLIGAGLFLVITSFGRAGPTGAAFHSRYLDVELVMILPALGVAADAIARRRPAFMLAAFVVLLTGVPSNIHFVDKFTADQRALSDANRTAVLSLAHNPLTRDAVPTLRPLSGVPVHWLLAGAASGRIPRPGPVDPVELETEALRLSLNPTRARGAATQPCRALSAPVVVRLSAGQSLRVEQGSIEVVPATGALDHVLPAVFSGGTVLRSLKPELTFRVRPESPRRATRICGPVA